MIRKLHAIIPAGKNKKVSTFLRIWKPFFVGPGSHEKLQCAAFQNILLGDVQPVQLNSI